MPANEMPAAPDDGRRDAGDAMLRAAAASGVDVPDPAAMRSLGARLAAVLRAGDLIVLAGPLGAGKTVFVQGVAAGLGAAGPVTSPTFVIARVHGDGRIPLVHVDAYRLGGVDEVDDLDLDADVETAVTVVEWGAGLVEQLTQSHLRIDIDRPVGHDAHPGADGGDGDGGGGGDGSDAGGEVRRVRFVPSGAQWSARLGRPTRMASGDAV
jgi:tRNA threonylcarbamoyladenosine biosynthesis protein TsaE